MNRLLLALDTTGVGGAVALGRGEEVIARVEHDPSRGYAEELFGLVDDALMAAGATADEIGAVAVVSGPGSFTGLRIGVMTAKSIAWARDLDLYAAATLPLIATASVAETVCSAADAGGGHVWAARFADGARPLGSVVRVPPSGLLAVPAQEILCADATLAERLRGADPSSAGRIRVTEPLAVLLCRAVGSGSSVAARVEARDLVPEYVSASQAERVHGKDMSDVVHREITPRGWS